MYMPLNGISINTVTPHITGNFCQNLAIAPKQPGNIKAYDKQRKPSKLC